MHRRRWSAVRANALGLSGIELPGAIEADTVLTERLEAIRRAGAFAMGIDPQSEERAQGGLRRPAHPRGDTQRRKPSLRRRRSISRRAQSPWAVHTRALPLTVALALAAAVRIPGTIASQAARPGADRHGLVRLGHPSGVAEISAELDANRAAPPRPPHRDPHRSPPDGRPGCRPCPSTLASVLGFL